MQRYNGSAERNVKRPQDGAIYQFSNITKTDNPLWEKNIIGKTDNSLISNI